MMPDGSFITNHIIFTTKKMNSKVKNISKEAKQLFN